MVLEISDVYEGDFLVIQTDDAARVSLDLEGQAALCLHLALSKPQMVLTAIVNAKNLKKRGDS